MGEAIHLIADARRLIQDVASCLIWNRKGITQSITARIQTTRLSRKINNRTVVNVCRESKWFWPLYVFLLMK